MKCKLYTLVQANSQLKREKVFVQYCRFVRQRLDGAIKVNVVISLPCADREFSRRYIFRLAAENGVEEVTITTSESNRHSQKWLVIFFKGKHMTNIYKKIKKKKKNSGSIQVRTELDQNN